MNTERRLHLAIIPDGNRRWAKRQALKPWQGHEKGAKMFQAMLQWAYDYPHIAVLTIWGFSTENWNRSEDEVSQLMRIYEEWLTDERQNFHDKRARFTHSGRTDRIPKSLAELIIKVTKETEDYTNFTLNFALDYGGKDEILRAVSKVGDPAGISEDSFRAHLDHPELPDIDVIVRTSGEQRISNFFLWQGAYAELFFVDKLFPDVTPADLEQVLDQFQGRSRRFGK